MVAFSKQCKPHLARHRQASLEGYVSFVYLQHHRHALPEKWSSLVASNRAAAEFERMHNSLALEDSFVRSHVPLNVSAASLRKALLRLFLNRTCVKQKNVVKAIKRRLKVGLPVSAPSVCTFQRALANEMQEKQDIPQSLRQLIAYDFNALAQELQSLAGGRSALCGMHVRLLSVPCLGHYLAKLTLKRSLATVAAPKDYDTYLGRLGAHCHEAAFDMGVDWSKRASRSRVRDAVLQTLADDALTRSDVWTLNLTSQACQWIRLRHQVRDDKMRFLKENALSAEQACQERGREAVRRVRSRCK